LIDTASIGKEKEGKKKIEKKIKNYNGLENLTR
jgi:hypothetical protein